MDLIEKRQILEDSARTLHTEVCEVLARAVAWLGEVETEARALAAPTNAGGAPLVPTGEAVAVVRAGLGEAAKAVGYLAVLAARHEATMDALAGVAAQEEREREAARQGRLTLDRGIDRALDGIARGALADPTGRTETAVTYRGRTVRVRRDGTTEDSGPGGGDV